jgi:hypothetical protein
MLEFNSSGLLVPQSVISSTLNEFEHYFAIESPGNIRKILFNQFIKYSSDLKQTCGLIELKQWIGGSFVTKKANPFDIDLVTFVSCEMAESNEKALKEFVYPASLAKYGIDAYVVVIYPDDHKLNFAYKADCAYWQDHFDKTKPSRRHKRIPKGFLEIIA